MRRIFLAGLAAVGLLAPFAHAADKDKADEVKPIKALLVIGGCYHDYAKQKDILAKGIAARANVEVTIAYDPETKCDHLNPVYENPDWAKGYDVVIHDECSADVKDLGLINRILQPHRDGVPGVVLHCGMHSYRSEGWPKSTPWFEFTGLQTTQHDAQKPIAITFVDKNSPITKGLQDWTTINEEFYNNITGKLLDTASPIARGKQTVTKNGQEVTSDNVCVWTNMYNKNTRVFATTLGHNNDTVADDRYLDLVTRGLLWATNHLADDGKPAPGYEAKK
ncbi:MAG TPA: ThuA domain-containing protein [Gemmataceae bacterium]|nr:ThuA domain-containing protein [Gemmataceae bacterium]